MGAETTRPLAVVVAVLGLLFISGGCSIIDAGDRQQKVDPNTLIDVRGAIGGIHAGEKRARAERILGRGKVISTTTRHPKSGAYTLTRVAYPASGLVVMYVQPSQRPPIVFAISTTSRRYHTESGLRVGSTLAEARKTPGIRCSSQVSYFACQGGLGYEKPVTSFTVRNGKVVRVFMAAVAD